MIIKKILIITIIGVLLLPLSARGEMSSASYLIYSDNIGWNGGGVGSSSGYLLTDTIGEAPVGYVTSTSYELRGGFQSMDRGQLSLSSSASAVNLGDLTKTSVKNSDPIVLSITTDSATGYSLSIGSVSNGASGMIAAVSDGAVTAGSEEYGFSISGGNALLSGDNGVSGGLLLASAGAPVTNDQLSLVFKASLSSGDTRSARADYTQAITLIASANF